MDCVKIKLPMRVEFLLNRLHDNGYEAYVVGGCVRDSVLKITPHDWDICTSATPDVVTQIFSDCEVIETGIKHGTVTVLLKSEIDDSCDSFEITTYRIDGEYKDNRHPEQVTYTSNLELDLARRDFTINAMAYNINGIVDPYGGEQDIKNMVIRCVGNPDARFKEDALRIIRAVRFSLRFGFRIEDETFAAMKRNLVLLKNISKERVCDEISKILSDKRLCDQIHSEFYFDTLQFFIDIVKSLSIEPLNINNKDLALNLIGTRINLVLRLAIIFRNTNVINILKHFKFSNDIVFSTYKTVYYGNKICDMMFAYLMDTKMLRHIARKLLCEIKNLDANCICDFALIISGKDRNKRINLNSLRREISRCKTEQDVYSLKYLAVNGNDLIAEGYSGKEIGYILSWLLDRVIYDQVRNVKEELLAAAKTIQLE